MCDRVAQWLRVLRTLLEVDILVERGNGAIPYETGWVGVPAGETKCGTHKLAEGKGVRL